MNKLGLKYIYNRKNNFNKKGLAVIELRLTYNRKIKYISTKIKILPEQWDSGKERIKKKHPNSIFLNQILTNTLWSLEGYEYDLIKKNETITLEKLRDFVNNSKKGDQNNFPDWCDISLLSDNDIKTEG